MKANITLNQEKNGIEISFESKPEQATIDALKANGYRWHRAKKIWYAKNTTERLSLAQSLTADKISTAATTASKASKAEEINLDNLGQNTPSLYGAELAKAIREDLKRRGVKGCTVRARRVTYDTGITVTIKATESDFASIEEMKLRKPDYSFFCQVESHGAYTGEKWIYSLEGYSEEEKATEYNNFIKYQASKAPSINEHHLIDHRNDYYTMSTAFYNKVVAVYRIANQWNYNHSDSMSDYFDVGYYLDIDIKMPDSFKARENMTEAEKAAYNAEIKAEEEKKAAELAAWEAEQEERRKEAEKAEKRRKEQREIIKNNITVVDLAEDEQIYITNIVGGIGKECSLAELDEEIKTNPHYNEALITRKVIFSNPESFAAFGELLMDDFEFLAGKGGTASEDIRLEGVNNLYSLNEDQRESVKWFLNDCIACYIGDDLQLICDPEGFTYCRYAFRPTEESEIRNATEESGKQKTESESKTPFYFPDSVNEQIKKLQPGQAITIYQCDGWMLNSINGGAGIVSSFSCGNYAQYNGVYINFTNGKSAFIRDNKKCLIYSGIKRPLPDSITKRQINDHMFELLNYDKLFPAILNYYSEQGEQPIIDTIQR
jgi:hypothetical protein